jgi:hypothetical protein
MVSNDFDWFGDETRESRIIPEQPETAVYLNPNGAAVIRQQGEHGEDPFVIIQPEYITTLIARLQHLQAEIEATKVIEAAQIDRP